MVLKIRNLLIDIEIQNRVTVEKDAKRPRPQKKKCIVSCCQSDSSCLKFSFPSNEKIGTQWVKAVQNPDLLLQKYKDIKGSCYICYKYFHANEYNRSADGRTRLVAGSLPTLNLPSKQI